MKPNAPINRLGRAVAAVAVVLVLAAAQAVQAAGPGVHGRVFALDESGEIAGVIPGAKVEFTSQAGAPLLSVNAAGGGYYRADLPPGRYFFKVTAPGYKDEDTGRGFALELSDGYAVYNFSLTRGENPPDRKPPELATEEMGKLQGRVMERTADGKLLGVAKARIALRPDGVERRLVRVIARGLGTAADQAGQYGVSLEAGTWRASVSADGFETLVDPQPIAIASDKAAARDFILTRLQPETPSEQGIQGVVRLKGKPADAQGTPQVKVYVVSLSRRSQQPEPQAPGPEGGFRRELAAGRYQVIASAEGYRPARSGPREVFPGRYTVVNLTLVAKPDGKPPLEKPVLDLLVFEQQPDGKGKRPLAGAGVLVRKSGTASAEPLRKTSDQEGKLQLQLDEPGEYVVLAQKFDYQPAGIRVNVTAEGDNRAAITLVKDRSQTPERLPDAAGVEPDEPQTPIPHQPEPDRPRIEPLLPVAGYVAYKNPASRTGYSGIGGTRLFWQRMGLAGFGRETASGQIGSYRLELPEGTYRVAVKPPAGFLPTSEQVVVRRGMEPQYFILTPVRQPDPVQPDRVRPDLERPDRVRPAEEPITVRGYVVTRSDSKRTGYVPLAEVASVWTRGSQTPNNVSSNARGEFTISLLPGTYAVYVKAPQGFQPKQQQVKVRPGMPPVYLVLESVVPVTPERPIPDLRIPDELRRPGHNSGPGRPTKPESMKTVALKVQVFERVASKPTRPIPGAQVFVEQNGRRTASGKTDGKGFVSFTLPAGACRIYVKHQAYGGAFEDVMLASPVNSRTLYLDRADGGQPQTSDPGQTHQEPLQTTPRIEKPVTPATIQKPLLLRAAVKAP